MLLLTVLMVVLLMVMLLLMAVLLLVGCAADGCAAADGSLAGTDQEFGDRSWISAGDNGQLLAHQLHQRCGAVRGWG